MKCPSADRLVAAFRDLDRKQANLIRRIAHATDQGPDNTTSTGSDTSTSTGPGTQPDPLAVLVEKHVPSTSAYVRRCYHDPYRSHMWRVTIALHAINSILGTFGVESLRSRDDSFHGGPSHEYLNAGDAYATTLVYYRAANALRIACWGDIVEFNFKSYE